MPMQLTDIRLIKSPKGEIIGAQMRWRDGLGVAGLYEGAWSEWVDVSIVDEHGKTSALAALAADDHKNLISALREVNDKYLSPLALEAAEAIDALTAAAARADDEYTPVKTDVLMWLLGENGRFECPEDKYFRGKPTPYFWRSALREAMLAPPSPQRVVDKRYAWLMDIKNQHWAFGNGQEVKFVFPIGAGDVYAFEDCIDHMIATTTKGASWQ